MRFINRTDVTTILAVAPEIVRPSVIDTYRFLDEKQAISAETTVVPILNSAPSRFISLPAFVPESGGKRVAGTKWVSNFRGNVDRNEEPFQSLLLVSDTDSGIPLACFEGIELNLRRTAASAYLAAECFGFNLDDGPVGLIGAGALAEAFCAELIQTYGGAHSVLVTDIIEERADNLVKTLHEQGVKAAVEDSQTILRESNVIILGTSAEEPWIDIELLPTDHRLILHISADDLPVEYFSQVLNVTDRISDAASQSASLGKAIAQGLDPADVLELPALIGRDKVSTSLPVVFSPFGLSVLDVALGERALSVAQARGIGIDWDHRG